MKIAYQLGIYMGPKKSVSRNAHTSPFVISRIAFKMTVNRTSAMHIMWKLILP